MSTDEIKKAVHVWVGREYIDGTTRRLLATAMEEIERLAAQVKVLQRDRDHWKANHETQVARARVLVERPDLPLERVQAFKQIAQMRNVLKLQIKEMRAKAEPFGPLHGLWDEIFDYEAILAGEPTQLDWEKEQ